MTGGSKAFGMFPGQGSQKVGMGKALFDSSPLAREMFQIADEALGFSLSELCFEGPEERLKETAITQPAILTVSAISFEIWRGESDRAEMLSAAAGHSLGEYSALVAAGALSFADAVQLVHRRGTYMQQAVPAGAGKMVAVMGKELDELEKIAEGIDGVAEIANINSPGQIVMAGSATGIDNLIAALSDARTVELPVSAPFHCSLMKPAEEKLAEDLKNVEFQQAAFPIYANYSAQPVSEPDDIREALRLQVCGQVRWVECVQNALKDTGAEDLYEIGEGKVLTGLMRRIDRSRKVQAV